jgi:hypothetical protein
MKKELVCHTVVYNEKRKLVLLWNSKLQYKILSDAIHLNIILQFLNNMINLLVHCHERQTAAGIATAWSYTGVQRIGFHPSNKFSFPTTVCN